ncbi:hypothetical protein BURK_004672 [Burkholderia sp. SJ98]|nr:hypothetical protein BURK_004672 [Burkholderia sp. SJ98]
MVAALSVAAAAPAFAEHAYLPNGIQSVQSGGPSAAPDGNAQAYGGSSDGSSSAGRVGKTRAEVVAELIQAQKDGLVPTSKTDYPPSERTIQRNKELYRARNR